MILDMRYTGGDGLVVSLGRLPRALEEKVVGDAMEAVAKEAYRMAKTTTAFVDRSGKLRASIKVERVDSVGADGKRVKDGAAVLVARRFYAPYVEYGHGGPRPAKPHPFLWPAVEQSYRRGVKAAERTVARGLPFAIRQAARLSGAGIGNPRDPR